MEHVLIMANLKLKPSLFSPALEPQGANLYFRLDIILVKGLSKHSLSLYFSDMKIDPNTRFCKLFLDCFHHVRSKICEHEQKHTLFSN